MRAATALEPASAIDAVRSFAAALSAGDVPRAAACFTREACLITPDGTAIHGRAEIVPILAQLAARRTELDVEQLVLHPAGDVCLAGGRFSMRSDGPEGVRYSECCSPILTLRSVEGLWKIAVLSPWAPLAHPVAD